MGRDLSAFRDHDPAAGSALEVSAETGFAERLRSAREGLEMSQRELSRRSGIDAPAICRFDSGYGTPSLRNLIRLLRAMPGVNANWLLGLTPERETSDYQDGYSDALGDMQDALHGVERDAERRFSEVG